MEPTRESQFSNRRDDNWPDRFGRRAATRWTRREFGDRSLDHPPPSVHMCDDACPVTGLLDDCQIVDSAAYLLSYGNFRSLPRRRPATPSTQAWQMDLISGSHLHGRDTLTSGQTAVRIAARQQDHRRRKSVPASMRTLPHLGSEGRHQRCGNRPAEHSAALVTLTVRTNQDDWLVHRVAQSWWRAVE